MKCRNGKEDIKTQFAAAGDFHLSEKGTVYKYQQKRCHMYIHLSLGTSLVCAAAITEFVKGIVP